MKQLIKRIITAIKKLWQKTSDLAEKVIPVAVDVVEVLKRATDSSVIELPLFVLKKAISGKADDVLIDKAYAWWKANMNNIINSLNAVDAIANIEDPNERLVAILKYYKTATSNEQAQFYSGLAANAAHYLSDGKLSLDEAFQLSKEYYDYLKNNK